VAAQLGVQKSVYCVYEKNNVKISPERLQKAAELCKVDLHIFFTESPLAITLHNNAVANGYVEQQHNGDKGLTERMFQCMEERSRKFEEMYACMMDLVDRMNPKKD